MLVAFKEDGEVCTIPYSKILEDQVLLDQFCTRPVFPVLRIGRMYATTAFYTRVHAQCDATRAVVLALYVCHTCLVLVSHECHVCGTRVTRMDCLSCG